MTSTSRPAASGWTWIVDAWTLFTRAPLPWMLITLVYLLTGFVMNFIPFAGQIALWVFGPVFAGGIMLGCRRLHEGGALAVGDLFGGFRTHFGALATVGAIYLVGFLAIVLVSGLAIGANLFLMVGNPAAIEGDAPIRVLLAILVAMALMLPLLMAVWFASPLVVLQQRNVVAALGESFSACIKNILPFTVYGLILLVFSMLGLLPVVLGILVLGQVVPESLGLLALLSLPMLLIWFVMGPVMIASVYTSYRDIFPA